MGPPLDGVFTEETQHSPETLQQYLKASCPQLSLLTAWDLAPEPPDSQEDWQWQRLESNALQGSDLSQ